MKSYTTIIATLIAIGACLLAGHTFAMAHADRVAHHDYVRRVELQVADLKGRLRVLEVIRIDLTVVDESRPINVVEVLQ